MSPALRVEHGPMPGECGTGPLTGPASCPNMTGWRAMEAPAINGEGGPMAKWNSEGLTARYEELLMRRHQNMGFPNVGFTNAGLHDGWFLSTIDQWTEKYSIPIACTPSTVSCSLRRPSVVQQLTVDAGDMLVTQTSLPSPR